MSGGSTFAVLVNHADPDFNAEEVMDVLSSFSVGRIWNFIPGVYLLDAGEGNSLANPEMREKVSECLPLSFLVLPIDPSLVAGSLPEGAWNAFWFGTFYRQIPELMDRIGSPEHVEDMMKRAANYRQSPHEVGTED